MNNEIFIIMGSYLAIILLGFGLINFLSNGFLLKFIRVKASRGRLCLVKIRSVTHDYYKSGKINDGFLTYKDNEKNERRIALKPGMTYRVMNVHSIDIDDETNAIINHNYEVKSGFDAPRFESLYVRALMRPSLLESKEKIIMILVVVAIIGIIFVGYFVYGMDQKIRLLAEAINALAV